MISPWQWLLEWICDHYGHPWREILPGETHRCNRCRASVIDPQSIADHAAADGDTTA
jgi:hypothetical protein